MHLDLVRQLARLDTAVEANDMNLPGWRLHCLAGGMSGHYSVTVNGNWRMTFKFEGKDVVLVDYQDYHQEKTMTRMFNPPHPGATLREDVLPALGLSVTQAAAQLNVTRTTLSRVLNEHAAISPEMALRLEGWLGVDHGGRADTWIALQAAYDLWQARKNGMPKVERAQWNREEIAA